MSDKYPFLPSLSPTYQRSIAKSLARRKHGNWLMYYFINILVTPFERQDAYHLGIIDKEGNVIKSFEEIKTEEEMEASTIIHRVAWKCRQIMLLNPKGRVKVRNWLAGMWFLKENADMLAESITNQSVRINRMKRKRIKENNTTTGIAGIDPTTSTPVFGYPASLRRRDEDEEENGDELGNWVEIKERRNITKIAQFLFSEGIEQDKPYWLENPDRLAVFEVSPSTYEACVWGKDPKKAYDRYFFDDDVETGEAIRDFARAFPKKDIFIKDKSSGKMAYFKKVTKRKR